MKISTDCNTTISRYGHRRSLEMIKEAGFDGVDYTFYELPDDKNMLLLSDARRIALAKELGEYIKELGLDIPQAHADFVGNRILREKPESFNYEFIWKSIECAKLMGADQIVVHTLKCCDEMPEDEIVDINVDFMTQLIPFAKEHNIKIGIENLFKKNFDNGTYRGRQNTAERMNSFIKKLNSDVFRVCCDLGHAAITGTEPEDFIRGMDADLMTMIHVQDTDYKGDRHWLPYMGMQNWEEICKALAEINFKGTMNIEVLHYYEQFDDNAILPAMKLAANVARYLAAKVESYKS